MSSEDHDSGDHHEPGPDLCIAMHGEYKCEGLKGHDGPHYALGGEIEWTEEFEDRQLITDGGQSSESADTVTREPLFSGTDLRTLNKAVDKWGIEAQADMAEEECAEFIAASKHHRRDKVPAEDVIDELADIRIMFEQLRLFFGPNVVDDRVRSKMDRLRERLEENDV